MLQVDSLWLPKTQQQQYRCLLNAMSRPGKKNRIVSRSNLSHSKRGSTDFGFLPLLAVLTDSQVSVSDPESLVDKSDWRLLQAEEASFSKADFIVAIGEKVISEEPKLGSLAHPEESATLILNVPRIGEGNLLIQLSGPGVDGLTKVKIQGLDQAWLRKRNQWCANFPLGIDMFLCDELNFIAIPRTILVEVF